MPLPKKILPSLEDANEIEDVTDESIGNNIEDNEDIYYEETQEDTFEIASIENEEIYNYEEDEKEKIPPLKEPRIETITEKPKKEKTKNEIIEVFKRNKQIIFILIGITFTLLFSYILLSFFRRDNNSNITVSQENITEKSITLEKTFIEDGKLKGTVKVKNDINLEFLEIFYNIDNKTVNKCSIFNLELKKGKNDIVMEDCEINSLEDGKIKSNILQNWKEKDSE